MFYVCLNTAAAALALTACFKPELVSSLVLSDPEFKLMVHADVTSFSWLMQLGMAFVPYP